MKRRINGRGEVKNQSAGIRPIAVRIPVAVQLTGISRSKLYELIKKGSLRTVKVGSSTLLPMDTLEQYIDANKS